MTLTVLSLGIFGRLTSKDNIYENLRIVIKLLKKNKSYKISKLNSFYVYYN